jgi:Ca-activated chloride channel family protein
MNDSARETRLKRMTPPPPDPQARVSAKRAALAEFARVQAANDEASRATSQASGSPERLSRQDGRGRFAMNWLVPRGWNGAFASVCVVALGATLLWPMLSRQIDPTTYVEPPVDVADEKHETAPAKTSEPMTATGTATSADDLHDEPVPQRAVIEVDPARTTSEAVDSIVAHDIDRFPETSTAEAPHRVPSTVVIPSSPEAIENESVVVTGHRAALKSAFEVKREASAGGAKQSQVEADQVIGTGSRNVAKPRSANPKLAAAGAPGQAYSGAGDGRVRTLIIATEPTSIQAQPEGEDKFRHVEVNPVKRVAQDPVSTFSVDVDTASYSFVRRALNAGALPPQDSVRVEEMINYFDYAWPLPESRQVPFEPTIVVSDSPWAKGKKLVHVAIKGYEVPRNEAPDVNLVLLLDVSGSMDSPDKLPLAVQSMELLVGSLKPTDTIGIVVYAGAAGTVLEPTPVSEKAKILSALRSLTPGGSTAGAAGIRLAYDLAEAHFRKGGVNRILLATDGDFNVGIANTEQLKGFVERKRENGVMLSVLGFGRGNYRDELSQALAQNGNGVAAYIDSLSEAQKVLVQESSGTLFTIAKDVKIQVEFNPARVAEYRLVGYETRALNREDFNNDSVDAGDVGAGHTVTAIYEITPVGSGAESVDPLRYGAKEKRSDSRKPEEYGFLRMRYKLPGENRSKLVERPIPLSTKASDLVGREARFSTAVAGFAQLLRGATFTGELGYDDVIREAQGAKGDDEFGYRTEFVQLVRKAQIANGM